MVKDELEETIKELQKKINYDEEQTYSKIVIREYRNPTHFGVLKHPDADGMIKGPCGDTMKITLKIVKGKIQNARFWTDGCGATLACGNMLTTMIKGKTLHEVLKISQHDLIKNLDGLPKEHFHCALLAVHTLRETVNNYKNKEGKEKWLLAANAEKN